MRARSRLGRLERLVGPPGCPACRDRRGRVVLVSATGLPDGTVVRTGERPQPCAACGQVPEQVIVVIEVVVDGVGDGAPPPGRGDGAGGRS
jgi:hypothetical protein